MLTHIKYYFKFNDGEEININKILNKQQQSH